MQLNATFIVNGTTVSTAVTFFDRYSDCIKLVGSFGSIVLPAAVTDACFDPREEVFAERTATLDNVTGEVTAFALTDGETEAASVSIEPLRVAGRIVVTVRVAPDMSCERVQPTYPDNRLLAWLLGCRDRPKFSIGLGHDRRRFDRPICRTAAELLTAPATVTTDGGAIKIEASFSDGAFDDELLLLADGEPVLRGPTGQLYLASRRLSNRPVTGRYCEIDSYNVTGFSGLRYNNRVVTGQLVFRDGALSAPERLPLKLPTGTLFACGDYLGIVARDEITVLQAGRVLQLYRNIAASEAKADCTADGAVVVCDDLLMTVYLPDGVRRYTFEKPDKLVVTGSADALHIGALYGTTLKRYRSAADMLALLETVADVTFLGRANGRLVYGNESQAFAETLDGIDEAMTATAKDALWQCGGVAQSGDGFLYAMGKAYDLSSGVFLTGFDGCMGDVLLRGGEIWTRDCSAAGFAARGSLPADTTAIGRVGDMLVGFDDEGCWTAAFASGKAAVYSEAFSTGGKATFSYTAGEDINEEGGVCRYGFTLASGGV